LADGKSVLSGSYDHTCRHWDIETGLTIDSVELHEKPVLCLTATRDGRSAFSGSGDGLIIHWDLAAARSSQ
jgi:transcription initiation factor TFIID subunit 5